MKKENSEYILMGERDEKMPAGFDFGNSPSQFENFNFSLDRAVFGKLKRLNRETGTTPYMVLTAAYNILLSVYSGQADIILGTPTAARPHADLQNIVGMFVNTLAMRNYPAAGKTFAVFLEQVKYNSLKAYENQDYQFEELIDKIDIKRDMSRNPLFDTMFTLQVFESGPGEVSNLEILPYHFESKVAKFDITMSAFENPQSIVFNLNYCVKLFKKETMQRFAGHFINLVKDMVDHPGKKLCQLSFLSPGEQEQLLYGFNDTQEDYSCNKTIAGLFEEQTVKTPAAIAFVGPKPGFFLTYGKLKEESHHTAGLLKKKGIKNDIIVGLMAESPPKMLIGMFAILKAGGAYLPIDPNYPEERIKYMLADSGAHLLLTDRDPAVIKSSKSIKSFTGGPGGPHGMGNLLELALLSSELSPGSYATGTRLTLFKRSPLAAAYIIYTSGTTGMPKGVIIDSKSIVNTLTWCRKYYRYSRNDTILQLPSFSFDSSVENIFTPLISGSRLVLLEREKRFDIEYLARLIEVHNVTHFTAVPALYKEFFPGMAGALSKMKAITVAGDDIRESLVEEHFKKLKNVELHNEYGPTENSVCSTVYKFPRGSSRVLIGKPISNTKVYAADEFLNPKPIGAAGELCISGPGVARGYLNRVELTAEKFDYDYHDEYNRSHRSYSSYIIYKTGDLVRRLPDGNFQFLGRIDRQVKIRGFRIEPGEIENCLSGYKGIKESVIILKEDRSGEKYFYAYYSSLSEISPAELKDHLLKKLPAYMIPSFFIRVEKFPLTSHGKIDRKVLSQMQAPVTGAPEYAPATNRLEQILVEIWSQVLNIDREKIGINHNFFDLGGHSLKAVNLMAMINKRLNIEISLKYIFEFPTIKTAAEVFARLTSKNYKAEENYVVFNEGKDAAVFCFPPQVAYGISYYELAKRIENVTFYSFDFIRHKNRLQEYTEKIVKLQKNGPYIFFGYSSGGTLAFEVARHMAEKGLNVSDIIMLDTICNYQEEDYSIEKVETETNNILDRFAEIFKGDKNIREKVYLKMKSYYRYIHGVLITGKIDANIHLVKSDSKDEPFVNNNWRSFTSSNYNEYKGFGSHIDMLQGDNLQNNALLVKELLQGVVPPPSYSEGRKKK